MENEQKPSKTPRGTRGFGVLAVQGISCAVVLLAVLAVRLLGGDLFGELRAYFQEAMQQNALTAAVHALWEDGAIYTTTTTVLPTTVTVAPTAPTAAQTMPSAVAAGGGDETTPAAQTALWTGGAADARPVSGAVVTSGFGVRDDPFGGAPEFHRGVDLAAPLGTPVAAMWAGEVTAADGAGTGSLGQYLRLRRADGTEVLYAHCSALYVHVGDHVAAGDIVAAVGSTGRSTGAHLHVQLERDGVLFDPTPLLADALDV